MQRVVNDEENYVGGRNTKKEIGGGGVSGNF